VSIKEGIGYGTVMGMIGRRVRGESDRNSFGKPGIIGIDEISLKKGHKDFVTVIRYYTDAGIRISGIAVGQEKVDVIFYHVFLSNCKEA